MRRRKQIKALLGFFTVTAALTAVAQVQFVPTGSEPGPSMTLEAKPPAWGKTIVLFDGTEETWRSNWIGQDGSTSQWIVQDDGSVLVKGGNSMTKHEFRDFQLHLEFFLPEMPDKQGQARANSGMYLQGRYEVQVLDSYGQPPADNGCGGIYRIMPPEVNACRPAGTWQTYDVFFFGARFAGDEVVSHPRVTVLHNGLVIHNNLDLPQPTPGGVGADVVPTGPLMLQDHGDPVRYRNIWIRPLG